MSAQTSLAHLPHPMATCPDARLALFVMRRIGAHGLQDACAVQAMVNGFGVGFRRPLMLARALMIDLTATATGAIAIDPCCCARIMSAQHSLLAVLASAGTRPELPLLLLQDLLGSRRVDGTLASAAALEAAFADAGRPIC